MRGCRPFGPRWVHRDVITLAYIFYRASQVSLDRAATNRAFMDRQFSVLILSSILFSLVIELPGSVSPMLDINTRVIRTYTRG